METFTQTQSQKAPEIPPQIAKMEQERKEALEMMIALFKEKRYEIGRLNSLIAHGREYPIREGSEVDKDVAEAQTLHKISVETLQLVKGLDYRKEEIGAKLEKLFAVHEDMVTRLAEIAEKYPEQAKELKKIMAGLYSKNEAVDDIHFENTVHLSESVGKLDVEAAVKAANDRRFDVTGKFDGENYKEAA